MSLRSLASRLWVPPIRLAAGLSSRDDNFLLLRIVAAVLVIYGHGYALVVHAPADTDLFLRLRWGHYAGAIGVDLFFVISGFLVTGSWLRRHSLPAFVWARALRLLPAYAVCMLLCAFVLGAAFTELPLRDYLAHPDTRGYVRANLGLDRLQWDLPGVFAHNPRRSTVNGSIWTLPIEVRMYLCVALLGGIGLLARRAWASAAIAALLLLGWFAPGVNPLLSIPGSARLAAMFALGASCYLHRDRIPVHGIGVVALAAACWCLRDTPAYPVAFALAETAFVFWFAYRVPASGFDRLGDYSYGLYLWGFPMQQVVAASWPAATPVANGLVALVPTTLLAVLSWHALEKPALRLKRGLPWRRSAPAAEPRP
ncbi:acyltransferase [Dokdonella sp.]|uniref:acyltransferase family protein n=1 Tax=Dokdonella sp. TaxID=2291710 RepID=UPI002F41C82F